MSWIPSPFADATSPLDTLLKNPLIWTQYLRESQVYIFTNPSTSKPALLALLEAVRKVDGATWRVVWSNAFVYYLARIVGSGCICGFTKEQLTSWRGQDWTTLQVIIGYMQILIESLNRLPGRNVTEADDPELADLLDILQHRFPQVWRDLWDVRTPFLDSKSACSGRVSEFRYTFHGSLSTLAMTVDNKLELRRGICANATNSHIPHIMLLIWIHNASQQLRTFALGCVGSILRDEPETWTDFYLDAAHDSTSPEKITSAFLRDLKDGRILNEDLYTLVLSVYFLRSWNDLPPLKLEGPGELQLVPWCLAATRRQLCLGDHKCAFHGDIVSLAYAFLKDVFVLPGQESGTPRLPAVLCYGIIGLVADYLVPLMESEDSVEGRDYVQGLVLRCTTALRRRKPYEDSLKILALRRHTHRAWKASTDAVVLRLLGRQFPAWRRFLIVWRGLGDLFPSVQESDDVSPAFELLQRCNWAECLCNVHKPAHRLRVCKGCWVVAYCSVKCQTSDWENGGHKGRCRRHTVS